MKDRLHLDFRPDDRDAEVERLRALGAARPTSARATSPGSCSPTPRATSSACSAPDADRFCRGSDRSHLASRLICIFASPLEVLAQVLAEVVGVDQRPAAQRHLEGRTVTGESGLPGQVWSPLLGLGEDADADLARGDVDLGADEAVTHRFPACACGLVHQQVDRGRRRGRRRAIRIQAPHDRVVAHRCRNAQRALVGGRRAGPSPGARAELRVWNHSCESASASSAASRPEANGRAPALPRPERPLPPIRGRTAPSPRSCRHRGAGPRATCTARVRGKVVSTCSAGDQHLAGRIRCLVRLAAVVASTPAEWTATARTGRTHTLTAIGRIRVPAGTTSTHHAPARSVGHAVGGGDPRGDP